MSYLLNLRSGRGAKALLPTDVVDSATACDTCRYCRMFPTRESGGAVPATRTGNANVTDEPYCARVVNIVTGIATPCSEARDITAGSPCGIEGRLYVNAATGRTMNDYIRGDW